MRSIFRTLADNEKTGSLADRLRRRRFRFFLQLLAQVEKPVRILDVGGTERFWRQMGIECLGAAVQITLLNTYAAGSSSDGFAVVVGDARSMPQFGEKEFDVVFSNSVIEHLPNAADQLKMAAEIRRVSKRYFIQTPNRYFPIEPHFLFPGFQFLPVAARAKLLQNFGLGWYERTADLSEALTRVQEIKLLKRGELVALFPEACVYTERFCGLAKSFIAYHGFAPALRSAETLSQ